MNVQKVGVIGCGLMGSGIAEQSIRCGFDVVVRELNDDPGYRVAADGMPPMLSDVTTEWRVDAAGGGSVVTQTFRGTLSDPAMVSAMAVLMCCPRCLHAGRVASHPPSNVS